jgi:hypothetical protein
MPTAGDGGVVDNAEESRGTYAAEIRGSSAGEPVERCAVWAGRTL